MSLIRIRGLRQLEGEIEIQGSKNAVLPLMAAALLHKGTTVLTNIPVIQDVTCMMGILKSLGCFVEFKDHVLTVDASELSGCQIAEADAKQMRSSIVLLGALLGRLGEARTYYPGGCVIGKRPIDFHISGLEKLGAEFVIEDEKIHAVTSGLHGCVIVLPRPSVGATENILLGAVLAEGVTEIHGASKEPEVEILCQFLQKMGCRIEGIGTATLTVFGGQPLCDVRFRIPGDRIVAGTYLGAVMAGGGTVRLHGAPMRHMQAELALFKQAGMELTAETEMLTAWMRTRPRAISVVTNPYPGFPTDLQSVMMAAAAVGDGTSKIVETVFEERFSTAKELQKMGAHIIIDRDTAYIEGTGRLKGECVTASDLRGGAALVVAGLRAEGETLVRGYAHICRGYEDICRDLSGVGAEIVLEDEG